MRWLAIALLTLGCYHMTPLEKAERKVCYKTCDEMMPFHASWYVRDIECIDHEVLTDEGIVMEHLCLCDCVVTRIRPFPLGSHLRTPSGDYQSSAPGI